MKQQSMLDVNIILKSMVVYKQWRLALALALEVAERQTGEEIMIWKSIVSLLVGVRDNGTVVLPS